MLCQRLLVLVVGLGILGAEAQLLLLLVLLLLLLPRRPGQV
jgi:hypothetical protein